MPVPKSSILALEHEVKEYLPHFKCHTYISKNPGSLQWRMVRDLKARYRVLLTGNPVSNSLPDLGGVMGIMEHSQIWNDFGLEASKCDPFTTTPGSTEAVLLCTQIAIEVIEKVPKGDYKKRGELIKRIYDEVMFKRTYATEINGMPIGSRIPPHKKVKVDLKIQDNLKDRRDLAILSHRRGLYRYGRSNGKGTIVMDSGSWLHRNQPSTQMPF